MSLVFPLGWLKCVSDLLLKWFEQSDLNLYLLYTFDFKWIIFLFRYNLDIHNA